MRFTWDAASPYGHSQLRAFPQEYDGHARPSSLLCDFNPRFTSPEAVAAASVLSFGHLISGNLEFPSAIRPETAAAIVDFLSPSTVNLAGIDFTPRPIQYPDGTFVLVGSDRTPAPVLGHGGHRSIALDLVPGSESYAFNYTSDHVVVPTNADAVAASSRATTDDRLWMTRVAVALLLAQDFDVGTIQLPRSVRRSSLLSRAAAVTRSAGFALHFATQESTGGQPETTATISRP